MTRDDRLHGPDWLLLLLLIWALIELLSLQQMARGEERGLVPGRAVVPVEVRFNGHMQRGSAVVFDSAHSPTVGPGWALLTARHVVESDQTCPQGVVCQVQPAPDVEVYLLGQWRAARIKTKSKYGDLALLTVAAAGEQAIACIASEAPGVGESITVAAMTLGLEYQAHSGRIEKTDGIVHELNCSRSVIGGQSGGGVFNAQGELVGIVSSHNSDAPWQSQFVSLTEIRRFVAAGWSGRAPEVRRRQGPEPRLAGEPGQVGPEQRDKRQEPADGAIRESPADIEAQPDNETKSDQEAKPGNVAMPPWWEFLASGIGLGVTIAGAAATGGAAWPVVIGPAIKTWRAGRAVLRSGRECRAQATDQRREADGTRQCPDRPVTAPPVSSPVEQRPVTRPPETFPREQRPVTTPAVNTQPTARPDEVRAPFPRQLDEARQLLELRQSEGRVGVLDQLRGMLLDDHVRVLQETGSEQERAVLRKLVDRLDSGVAEIAPLSVKV